MTPEISEFSYGFALTNEIVGWSALRAAPIFPSLIEEGKKGGGYDVKLDTPGVPLYLQFKRADCMKRRSAKEISRYGAALSVPFYRFSITESGKSDQHAMLLELDDGTSNVFYAAPRFHELEEINHAWAAKEVAGRSIFVRPKVIGALNSESHHVAFDSVRAYLCSQPKLIEFLTARNLAEQLVVRLNETKRPLRETIPELNIALGQAWNRARERSGEPRIRVMTSPAPSQAEAEVQRAKVATRTAVPLTEDFQRLRDLADNALKLFDVQLVIVQKG